jgi:small-conductance mechanosensitive channel
MLLAAVLLASPLPAQSLDLLGGDDTPAQEPEGPISTQVDEATDRAIVESLERRLGQDDALRGIAVTSDAGVVRISGEALSAEARERAGGIARRTEGVVSVANDIELVTDVRERLNPALSQMRERLMSLVAALPLFAIGLLIVLFAVFVAGQVSRWERPYGRLADNRFVLDLAHQVTRAVIVGLGILVALELLEATAVVGAVLGAAGVLGLAVGFAFRDLVENYIAGVLLAIRQPFEPNDLITVDGEEGKVVRLTNRATILMTRDGNHLRIPNSAVFKGIIVNYTRNPRRRFQFLVGIGTAEDLLEAQRLGAEAIATIDGVLDDPPPTALVEELGDSSVSVRFFGWVDQRRTDFQKARSEALRRVKIALEEADMDLPEPIYRIMQVEAPPVANKGAAAAHGPSPAPSPTPAGVSDPEDLSPAADPIDREIAEERASAEHQDLLDEGGGKE